MLIIERWFEEALKLRPGEDLFLPVGNMGEGKEVRKALLLYKKRVMEHSPIEAFPIKVTIDHNIGERKIFVRLHREGVSPELAFRRDGDGKLTKVEISLGEEERIKRLMAKDGFSEEEIDEYFSKEKAAELPRNNY